MNDAGYDYTLNKFELRKKMEFERNVSGNSDEE